MAQSPISPNYWISCVFLLFLFTLILLCLSGEMGLGKAASLLLFYFGFGGKGGRDLRPSSHCLREVDLET